MTVPDMTVPCNILTARVEFEHLSSCLAEGPPENCLSWQTLKHLVGEVCLKSEVFHKFAALELYHYAYF